MEVNIFGNFPDDSSVDTVIVQFTEGMTFNQVKSKSKHKSPLARESNQNLFRDVRAELKINLMCFHVFIFFHHTTHWPHRSHNFDISQLQVFDANKDGRLQLSEMAKWVWWPFRITLCNLSRWEARDSEFKWLDFLNFLERRVPRRHASSITAPKGRTWWDLCARSCYLLHLPVNLSFV